MEKMMRMTKGLIVGAMLWTTGAMAYYDVPADNVYINRIVYGGNGCPQGTVSELVSPDKQSFTLLMDEYIAELGPYIERAANRKSCQIGVELVVPAGWSYSVATIDYRGYANLDPGVTGTHMASYYFQGQGTTGRFASNFAGPYVNNYQVRDTIGLEAQVWSPCGQTRALNIKSEVRLAARNRNAQGVMTVDSVDGTVAMKYGIVWRRCH